MDIPNTAANQMLASTVNGRLRAEARWQRAKAAAWYMRGFGVMALLIGAGTGLAFYGYAYVHDPRTSVEKMAAAISQALEKTTLHANGEVALRPDSTVALDTSGASVKLDTSGADNPPSSFRPSERQLGMSASPQSKSAVVTNFTVFKTTPYGNGLVVTGWNFNSSNDARPKEQYCYYKEPGPDAATEIVLYLVSKGKVNTLQDHRIDAEDAIKYCVWYGGKQEGL